MKWWKAVIQFIFLLSLMFAFPTKMETNKKNFFISVGNIFSHLFIVDVLRRDGELFPGFVCEENFTHEIRLLKIMGRNTLSVQSFHLWFSHLHRSNLITLKPLRLNGICQGIELEECILYTTMRKSNFGWNNQHELIERKFY